MSLQAPVRRIVKIVNASNISKAPLVLLDCGHETRSDGRFTAKCRECPKKQKPGRTAKPL